MALSRTQSIAIITLAAVLLIAVAWFAYEQFVSRPKSATMTFMDVGQGDATLIASPHGEQMLIDCGKNASVLQALGRNMPFFDRTIEHLIVTHPDADHFAGCIDVLGRYHVRNFYYNGIEKDNDQVWNAFAVALLRERLTIHVLTTSTAWDIGSVKVQSLFPDQDARVAGALFGSRSTDNNFSVVLRVVAGKRSYLLTGDAEKEQEGYLVRVYGGQLDADVLKVGHHGSKTSSAELFLRQVTPEVAVISAGKDNRYGHPHGIVLNRLGRYARKIHRTDLEGDIVFVLY